MGLTDQERERIRARKKKHKPAPHVPGQAPIPPNTEGISPLRRIPRVLRGWADALFFAFLLAMFIRTYVFELFMIPTGSMTPTLIGDDRRDISELDWDGDGDEDIILMAVDYGGPVQVHLRDTDGQFGPLLYVENPTVSTRVRLANAEKGKGRRDMIMVNKFAYWFSPPGRGDIAVFKVPDRPEFSSPFLPEKPVYIKRVVGLPGERVEIQPLLPYVLHPVGHPDRITPDSIGGTEAMLMNQPVLINGEPVTAAPFDRLHHFPPPTPGVAKPSANRTEKVWELGNNEVLMLGDNQTSSADSRYWGPVPLSHMRGKAILRYLPVRSIGFLKHGK